MRFAAKVEPLMSLRPDIAVISECGRAEFVRLSEFGFSAMWFGENPKKGLGILLSSDYHVRSVEPSSHQWIVPLKIEGRHSITLIAVWACGSTGPNEQKYSGRVLHAVKSSPHWFDEKTVMAGDFNSNVIWDGTRKANFSAVLKELQQLGLESAYHRHEQAAFGAEPDATFFMYRKRQRPYHIDYVFVPRTLIVKQFAIGRFEDWAPHSDHMPIVATISFPT